MFRVFTVSHFKLKLQSLWQKCLKAALRMGKGEIRADAFNVYNKIDGQISGEVSTPQIRHLATSLS